jgi:DNA (cytosine-5)-methyltransferase 1
MKILNLYAGIGGNRKLWGDDHEVTAVEYKPEIAKIYQDFFPKDKVIVADAHKYLLEHFGEFDFIWSSPPCPSHSRIRTLLNAKGVKHKFPDMKLYEEIILLKHFFKKGKFVIENVRSYYEPLIKPQEVSRHYFWANFLLPDFKSWEMVRNNKGNTLKKKMNDRDTHITDWHGYDGDKRTLLNNMIEPELGKRILEYAINPIKLQGELI